MTAHPRRSTTGPYDVSETPDFYAALGHGTMDAQTLSDCLLRLIIAQGCRPGARVVDVGCGTGLQLPLLYEYAPTISSYTGLEIAPINISHARERVIELDQLHNGRRDFTVNILQWDVASPWPDLGVFDIAVYTEVLQLLPRASRTRSLHSIAAHLAPGGVLFLSATWLPNRPTEPPPPQPTDHAGREKDLVKALEDCGFALEERIGLSVPDTASVARALEAAYGTSAAAWHQRLSENLPEPFLAIAEAAALPDIAADVLYICRRR